MNAHNTVRSVRSVDVGVISKYLVATTVASAAWIGVLASLFGSTIDPPENAVLATSALFVSMAGVGLSGAWIHARAPDELVDRFHKLGVYFAMFVVGNAIVTVGGLLFVELSYSNGTLATSSTPIQTGILLVVISSVFLPGPYAGLVAARRWSK